MQTELSISGSLSESLKVLNAILFSAYPGSMLNELLHDQLGYGHTSGLVENKKELIKRISLPGKPEYKFLQIKDKYIKCINDTAMIRQALKATVCNDSTETPVAIDILLVWIKKDENWQLIERQAIVVN
jgi:hypothetical protein